jgi:signal transduction histidine kinase
MTQVSAYRWQLSEALQSSSEPSILYRAALRLLGEYLHAYRAVHVFREGPQVVVAHEYTAGAGSMIGRNALARFSPKSRERFDGRRLHIVNDVALAPNLLDHDRAFLNANGIRSYLSVSLSKRWDVAGSIVLHSAEPREWTAEEIDISIETADRTWDAVQRAVAERELRAAAHRDTYRLTLTDVLRDLDDEAAIRNAAVHALGTHLGVNRAFYVDIEGLVATVHPEYLDGVWSFARTMKYTDSTVTKMMREGATYVCDDVQLDDRISDEERAANRVLQARGVISVGIVRNGEWLATLIVHTCEPRRWAAEEVSLVEDTAERIWTAIARVRGEMQLRQSAARDALRLKLADTLRLATDVTELRSCATRLLGEYLAVDRVLLVERDGAEFLLHTDYSGKLPPIPGRYPLASFSSVSDTFLRGEAIIVADLETDTTLGDDTRASFQKVGTRAVLAVPLFRSGRLIAALVIHQAVARRWREEEVALVADAAERIWSAMERVHQERALRESEAALREAARNKDTFLAVLAHELRNPLAPLQTSVELMYRAVEDPRMLIEITAIMERQVGHVTRLVDDLLDAARVTHGALRIERAPTSLAQILDEATDMHRRACLERGIKLTKTVERAVNVDVDRVRVVQVVANLIHNAVKFTGPRGEINVRAHVYGTNVMVTVEDNGIGIAEELLPFVFELFHHATDERGGLGVGLALSRQLVQLHGGTITVRARDRGTGTVFEVRLPDSVTEQPLYVAPPVPMQSITTPRDILIVDDNDDIVRATSILIQVLGATPHVATSGADALALASRIKPVAALLDISMPTLDGYEVCRQLRTMFGTEIRLVAYTGFGRVDDKRRALDAGFDQHITKPAQSDTLARALRLKH